MNGTVAVASTAEVVSVGVVAFTDATPYATEAAGAANAVLERQSAAMQKEAVIIALEVVHDSYYVDFALLYTPNYL